MENKKSNMAVIILLIIIIAILTVLCILFATGTIYLKSNSVDKNSQSNESISDNSDDEVSTSTDKITKEELEKIVIDELYIITNRNTDRETIKSINDIENYDLVTLVINKFNSSMGSLTSISEKEMQDILNDTCLSNMTIKYNGTYTKNESTKVNLFYGKIGAFKTTSFNKENGKYTLSQKYIFVDNNDSGDRGLNGYGNMDDLKDSKKPLVQLRDYSGKILVDDIQEYLNDNFDNIKDKLTTYNYTFEKQNDKIILTDLSVN